MATIGVRELKRDASRDLRRVRERGEETEITHHARVVARLVPVAPQRPRRPPSAAWSTLDRVAREIGARWPKGWSGRTGRPGRTPRSLMVVDASVLVSHLVPSEGRHEASRRWIARHLDGGGLVVALALLLPEVAGAIARRTGTPRLARRAIAVVLRLPSLRLLTIGEELARAAAGLAARLRIRGADAVYIAAAAQLHLPLVTWDVEQRERAARVVEVLVPA